ncbi:hypothetical protein [Symbiobacterium thermophilum]|uniref:hypothetical protein n=1 Tax=Symbiobacterium thermophilum TaxID=2734 RepID=UPI00030B1263|nr:hypothetical protein [Symbiobacterium thermophilum]
MRERSEEEAAELLRLRVPGTVVFDEIALAAEVVRENRPVEARILWTARLTGA